MCLPLVAAAAVTAAAVGSTVMNYVGTQQAHHFAVQSANQNYNAKLEQVDRDNSQLTQQQGQTNLSDAVSQAQAFGRIAVSASSMGLGRYSSHQLLSANAAAYNRRVGLVDTNFTNKRQDLQTEIEGANIQRTSAILQAPRTNLGQLALGLVQAAGQGATTYGALGGKFGVQPVGGAGKSLQGQSSGPEFGWT